MSITVKSFLTLRPLTNNQSEIVIDGDLMTIRELLDRLREMFGKELSETMFEPETQEIRQLFKIIVNGRHYTTLPDKIETVLKDGDVVAIFPPLAGG
ncbi:MAG: MoaD/ThiS family protein [Deltaproteobacteria bacterium]|jgi:sulfur-carrier protein|nr:MoaD/ThiS family protein [Deltaproteobacteria bacterium]MBT4267814.1 MoaD/ThiS family protein [Deltaproteobacteria bacterium]MBT4644469.1 MoaD/ThiS family protein [Deltaproteobacteria bacterium]MBT6504399.1 MoaD/ThiS family protein [Deltaproteobacteria bacterium]MBT6611971.1 MoaD/ThiS family protein [Deltaproteobacteria bacterium]